MENAAEVSVDLDTLLNMFQAVNIRPAHLRGIGKKELADELRKRESFAAGADTDELQEYLENAPASDEMRRALIIAAKTLEEIREGRRGTPFSDEFPPPRAGNDS